MNLVLVANVREQRVAEDAIHDVKEWVQYPSLLATGKLLRNIVWLELVFVSRLGVGMRANTNGLVKPLITNM